MAKAAVGFIETRGLIAVIEAADTAVKAASVELMGFEQIGGGMVAVRFSGDVASVQVAVQAAVQAARQMGEVASHHVIPAPHADVFDLLIQSRKPVCSPNSASTGARPSLSDLESMPVARLRKLVRQTPGVQLKGRRVSHANKEALLTELHRAWQE